MPTLKTLPAQSLVKDIINYWENKANNARCFYYNVRQKTN